MSPVLVAIATSTADRPGDLFDRVPEWDALTRFVSDEAPGATLGIVSGWRRQGKSYLLETICEAASGFYFAATAATEEESLRSLASELAFFTNAAVPLRLGSWDEALDALVELGNDRPIPVVIDLRDRALYHSVLAAVANGNQSRGGIARYVGRPNGVLGHPLAVLEDSGFLVREEDAFHSGRNRYRIAEPLISFYHAMMRRVWSRLERPGRAAREWSRSQERFASNVLGPHFERIVRSWVRDFAAAETFDGVPARVLDGVLNDPRARGTRQVTVTSWPLVLTRADARR